MNLREIGHLLAAAKLLDSRFPAPDDAGLLLRAWSGLLAEVPAADAERALAAYYVSARYLERREPISPADIVQWWTAHRRPTEREREGGSASTRRTAPRPAADPQRIRAGVDKCRAVLAARRAQAQGVPAAELVETARAEARVTRSVRSVPCPHCKAEVGRPCVGPSGGPLRFAAAHDSREAAALAARSEPAPSDAYS